MDFAGNGFTVEPLLRYYEDSVESPLPTTPPIIEGLLRERGRLVIGGEPGVGKSILALQLCWSFATGVPFVGLPVAGPIRTLYVQTELEPDQVEERWKHQAPCYPNLERGWLAHYQAIPWIWHDQVTQLADVILKGEFEALVLDPFSAICEIDDENDSAKMNRMLYQELDGLKRYCNLKALIIVHHFRKPQPQFQSAPSLASLRGAGLGQWCDAFIGVLGSREHNDATLLFDKLRAYAPLDPLMVTRDDSTLTYSDASWQIATVNEALADEEWHTLVDLQRDLGIGRERLNAIVRDAQNIETGQRGRVKRVV